MSGVQAFAPGRVNLIGEHTDYNDGLCLPFAIERGVEVSARPLEGRAVEVHALDLGQSARFAVEDRSRPRSLPADGEATWHCFVRGALAELRAGGIEPVPCRLEIRGDLPRGAGLSSSAALSVALCLALTGLTGAEPPGRIELARLCSRIENDWCDTRSGLLDQLACLFGEPRRALRLDMRSLQITPVELALGGYRLATLESGASRRLAGSGYNERRDECRRAARALGVESLRGIAPARAAEVVRDPAVLAEPLGRRVRHVLSENERVERAVEALRARDPERLGALLNASHASLRDDYEVSLPAVERAVAACRQAGAEGARLMGGGFGGSVLALFAPGRPLPAGAVPVSPGAGARLL